MTYKDAIPVEWLENWSCRVNDYTEALLFRECKMRILEDWKKSRSISTDETGSENYTVTTLKGKMIPIKLERRDELVRVVRCKDCVWFKTNHTWSGREYKVCVREAYEPMREDEDYCSGGRRRDEDETN